MAKYTKSLTMVHNSQFISTSFDILLGLPSSRRAAEAQFEKEKAERLERVRRKRRVGERAHRINEDPQRLEQLKVLVVAVCMCLI